MKRAIQKSKGGRRPGAGRPATGQDPVRSLRLSDEFMEKVDAWAARQENAPGRSEAIRRLVELGLTVGGKAGRSSDKQKTTASDLAGTAIDRMEDSTASAADKAQRKRHLIKGPEEFQNTRIDRPKRKT